MTKNTATDCTPRELAAMEADDDVVAFELVDGSILHMIEIDDGIYRYVGIIPAKAS